MAPYRLQPWDCQYWPRWEWLTITNTQAYNGVELIIDKVILQTSGFNVTTLFFFGFGHNKLECCYLANLFFYVLFKISCNYYTSAKGVWLLLIFLNVSIKEVSSFDDASSSNTTSLPLAMPLTCQEFVMECIEKTSISSVFRHCYLATIS